MRNINKNKLILLIVIVAACLAILVGCSNIVDLSRPDTLQINVIRDAKLPSGVEITATTNYGEISNIGDVYTLSVPSIKKCEVSFSAKGYKTQLLNITPDILNKDSVEVDFGATIGEDISFNIANIEELPSLTIQDQDASIIEFEQKGSKVTFNRSDIYRESIYTISADGYVPLMLSATELMSQEVYLTEVGTCLITVKKYNNIDNVKLIDEQYAYYEPITTSLAYYFVVDHTDNLFTIDYGYYQTANFNAKEINTYGNIFMNDNNYKSIKLLNYINNDGILLYQTVKDKVEQLRPYIGNNNTHINIPNDCKQILIQNKDSNKYCVIDISNLTEINMNTVEYDRSIIINYIATMAFTGEKIKNFSIYNEFDEKVATTDDGIVRDYYESSHYIKLADGTKDYISHYNNLNNLKLINNELIHNSVLQNNINIKIRINDYKDDIIIDKKAISINNDGYYYLNLNVYYTSVNINITSVNGDFNTFIYDCDLKSFVKNSDGSYTYNRDIYINYFIEYNLIFMKDGVIRKPTITVFNNTQIIKNGESYILRSYKNMAKFTAVVGDETVNFDSNLTDEMFSKQLCFDLDKGEFITLNEVYISIAWNNADCSFRAENGILVFIDNKIFVSKSVEVYIETPINRTYYVNIIDSDSETRYNAVPL